LQLSSFDRILIDRILMGASGLALEGSLGSALKESLIVLWMQTWGGEGLKHDRIRVSALVFPGLRDRISIAFESF
jgi:hypothetical protein